MKVCICTNTRPHAGGVTTYINTLAKYFNLTNHPTVIVSPFGISQEIKIRPGLVSQTDKLMLNKSSVTFVLLIISQVLTFFNLLRAYFKNRYQVIIAQDPASVNVARILQKIFKITVVLAVHDTLPESLLRQKKVSVNDFTYRYALGLEKKAMKISNGVYTDCDYILDFLKNRKAIPVNKPTAIINPPVDSGIFSFDPSVKDSYREKLGIGQNQFIILFVGQISDIKGAIYPVYALQELVKSDSNFTLVYAGDGPQKQDVIDLAKKFNLEKKVILLGKIPPTELKKLYNTADVSVIPSVTIQGKPDTHPLVVMEAAICRLPVVASASGGLKEIIDDNQTGMLFAEKDYKKIAQAILKLKLDTEFRKKIIENAYLRCRQNYLPEKMIEKLLGFVEDVGKN